jgi:biopolymer transport protein ExbB
MLELLQKAGWVAYPLAIFSVLALAIILERLVMLSKLGKLEETAFNGLVQQLSSSGELKLDDPIVEGAPVTVVIKTVAAMRGASEESKQTAAEIGVSIQRLRLRRYLGLLATIGSVSPFVGLFGTVLGVLYSFQSMQSQGMGGEKMAAGIGEALSATAIGLGVAIPSVMAYNYFTGRIASMVLTVHAHVAQIIPLLDGNAKPARVRQEA